MSPMKILLAYDGSPEAEAAADEVSRRPWPEGTQVRLITVLRKSSPSPGSDVRDIYAPLAERVAASMRKEAYHNIRRVLGRFSARADLEASYEMCEGSVKQCLLRAILEWKPDLVVAATAQGRAAKGPGSVAQTLVACAPCTVEIFKTPTAA